MDTTERRRYEGTGHGETLDARLAAFRLRHAQPCIYCGRPCTEPDTDPYCSSLCEASAENEA